MQLHSKKCHFFKNFNKNTFFCVTSVLPTINSRVPPKILSHFAGYILSTAKKKKKKGLKSLLIRI